MKILVTGSLGFLGKNILSHLKLRDYALLEFNRGDSFQDLEKHVKSSDLILHLAGVNRPTDVADFEVGNTDLTKKICDTLLASNLKKPIIYASSTQAALDNAYGNSKRRCEEIIQNYSLVNNVLCKSYRFPNIFGKWSKPKYNSAVATFCHSVANDLPFEVHNRNAPLQLIYVDDVVELISFAIESMKAGKKPPEIEITYQTNVGEVSDIIASFGRYSETLEVGSVGAGLKRALYSTYVSFLPTSKFAREVKKHTDQRGDFVEMLRTPDCGQFSYFTAHPGVTRGCHYHHTKTEKFLVIQGIARFKFRNLITDELFEICTDAKQPMVVDTIPGWVHDITNIGSELLIVALWANEKFNREHPDTYSAEV